MIFGKYINKYYLKYGLFLLIGVIALITVDYAQTFIPEYLGNLVNLVDVDDISNVDMDVLLSIIKGVLIVAFIMFVGRFVWRITIFNASQKIEAAIRHEMFLKSERLSQRFYHENKVGAVMAWFTNDLETIEEMFGWGTMMLVDALFLSVIVIIKMIKLEWVLSLIIFIPIILIIIWGALVEKHMSLRWENRQKAFDNLYDFSQENFTGIRVIKAFVKETKEIHAFAKVARKNADVNIDFVKVSVLFDVFISIIISAIMVIIIGFGGWFVYSFVSDTPVVIFNHTVTLDAGNLITFIGYFETLIWPMMCLGQIVSMRSRGKASLKRITAYLDQEEEIKNPKDAIILENVKGKITFKNFSFAYPNSNKESLNNINLEIKAGETIGVVGKIGSGKSTFANSLLRLYNLEKESVFIDDIDIMECNIASVRDNIGYVPQDNFLFSDKVKNNIAFFNKDIDDEKIIEAAKFAAVHDNIVDFKEGYDTISGERGVTLSGGQKQRISIARAFIKDAPIMILDDSVSAVDVKTEETILNNIKEQRKNKTTIVIASRVSTVSHMDRIIVLNNGKIEAFDTHDNLLEISPTYKKMVHLQELEKEVEGGAK